MHSQTRHTLCAGATLWGWLTCVTLTPGLECAKNFSDPDQIHHQSISQKMGSLVLNNFRCPISAQKAALGFTCAILAAWPISPSYGFQQVGMTSSDQSKTESPPAIGTTNDPKDVYGPPAPAGADEIPLPPPGISEALTNAIALALNTYPSLSSARSSLKAAGYDVNAAKWLRGPSVSVSAVTRDDRVGSIRPEVQVFQPLWTGGRINGAIERAKAQRQASQAELEETAYDIVLRLGAAYYSFARAVRISSILEQSLSEHERLVSSMERRVEQEVSPRSDLDLARSRAAQVRQELSLVTAQRFATLQQIREFVGEPDFDPGPVPEYSSSWHHPSSEGLVEQALRCDPRIRRLRAEAEVADADRKISRASIYPQVGLQYSYDSFNGNGVGLAVQAQTNGGLSPLAAAQSASARSDASRFRGLLAEREARETIVLDLVQNTSARDQIESSRSAVDSSTNVTDSFMRQFITGRRTWLDVMNAVREATAARVTLTEAEISAMNSSMRLQIRSCIWQLSNVGDVR